MEERISDLALLIEYEGDTIDIHELAAELDDLLIAERS